MDAVNDTGLKTCAKCKISKSRAEFWRASQRKDGLKAYCIECIRKYNAENAEKLKEYFTAYSRKNRDVISKKNSITRATAEYKEYARRYHKAYQAKLRLMKPGYRLRQAISVRVTRAMFGKGGSRLEEILGYKMPALRLHIERQFVPGMTWENYGKWHVDHIMPLADFDFSVDASGAAKAAWCLTNLRPIWAKENLVKGRKKTFLI